MRPVQPTRDLSPTLPQLIAARCQTTPHSPALMAGDAVLTYADLARATARVAHVLYEHGVTRGHRVALVLPRGPHWVIACLAAWQLGAAYLPIDPEYGVERTAFMLSDASVSAVLTTADLVPAIPQGAWSALVVESETGDPVPSSRLTVSASETAYVMYTSGSTGHPKGVEITHDNLSNLVAWHLEAFGITPVDRATQVAGPAFDACGWEVWPYLAAGATVEFPPEDTRFSAAALRDHIVSRGITMSFMPTVLAEDALRLPWPDGGPLRYLLTGGDRLRTAPPSDLPFPLVNNYGPTEGTVVATSGVVPPGGAGDPEPSIGWPISGVEVYLLDENRRPVATGERGEIYLGGRGVASGYLNRPELTAERFVPHPLNPDSGGTLYRTGDFARRLPNGSLSYIGRTDDQVQVRGYRVELGEIETALARHSGIEEAVVVSRGEGGERSLAAYLVPRKGDSVTAETVVDFLRPALPAYMIPAHMVMLDRLPVTPNGKIDRSALPAPAEAAAPPYLPPQTPTEERLAAIVAELLGYERVSREDNFFLLGGHSLLGAQLVARVGSAFGIELSLFTVFEAPTVAQLAVAVEDAVIRRLDEMSEDDVHRLLV